MTDLLPCPFCKLKAGLFVQEIVDGNDMTTAAYVKCDACKAQGPECSTIADAESMWNNSPQPLSVAQGWQDISTAPRDGTAIMLGFWYQGRFAQYQAFYSPEGWAPGWLENSRRYHPDNFQKWFELWHPLPKAPAVSSTNCEGGK